MQSKLKIRRYEILPLLHISTRRGFNHRAHRCLYIEYYPHHLFLDPGHHPRRTGNTGLLRSQKAPQAGKRDSQQQLSLVIVSHKGSKSQSPTNLVPL
jgi:hypothetical protein